MKKFLATALVAVAGTCGLAACSTTSPDAMCDVMIEHFEEFDTDRFANDLDSLSQINALGALFEAMNADFESVAPDEIASDVAQAQNESRRLATMTTSEVLAQGISGQFMEMPAQERVFEYVKENSKCDEDYVDQKLDIWD